MFNLFNLNLIKMLISHVPFHAPVSQCFENHCHNDRAPEYVEGKKCQQRDHDDEEDTWSGVPSGYARGAYFLKVGSG
jgi:hypothetical protein